MNADEEPAEVLHRMTSVTRSKIGVPVPPAIRSAVQTATGLSEDRLDAVVEALARLGVGLVLPNGADIQAKYANAIALVRDHDFSITRAAREVGISATHLTRKLNAIGADGDLQRQAAAGDQRILEMSQALSTLSGERLLDRMEQEGDRMKVSELAKVYTSSTNQVAAKQRWSQGTWSAPKETGVSALVALLEAADIEITRCDPLEDAVDITPPEDQT